MVTGYTNVYTMRPWPQGYEKPESLLFLHCCKQHFASYWCPQPPFCNHTTAVLPLKAQANLRWGLLPATLCGTALPVENRICLMQASWEVFLQVVHTTGKHVSELLTWHRDTLALDISSPISPRSYTTRILKTNKQTQKLLLKREDATQPSPELAPQQQLIQLTAHLLSS